MELLNAMKDDLQRTEITVMKYKPTHTEIKMSIKEFCHKYRDNLANAFSNWQVMNEEHLPMSVIKDTYEETMKAELEIFLKDFVRNFNENAYNGAYVQTNEEYQELGGKGLCKVKMYNPVTYSYEDKILEYIHIY